MVVNGAEDNRIDGRLVGGRLSRYTFFFFKVICRYRMVYVLILLLVRVEVPVVQRWRIFVLRPQCERDDNCMPQG